MIGKTYLDRFIFENLVSEIMFLDFALEFQKKQKLVFIEYA